MSRSGWWRPPHDMSCSLLVSVRDADEARAAVAGGATIVDVKEPDRGPLGRADGGTAAGVAAVVGPAAPWTLAAGELADGVDDILLHLGDVVARLPTGAARPAAVKVGLAGLGAAGPAWSAALQRLVAGVGAGIDPVAVAYLDWERAAAPAPRDVILLAARLGCRVVLFDTFDKQGPGALDSPTVGHLPGWIAAARQAGLAVALAGRLDGERLPAALALRPDVLGFRSAACVGGRRGRISGKLVAWLGTLCRPAALEPDGRPSGARA